MFPGILGRTNHALNSAVTKAAGDKDPINALEDFVKICFRAFHINRIDVFDFHIGMVVEAGMLQGFDDTDVSIGQFDVFSYDADFRLVLVGGHDLVDHVLPFLHVAGTVFHVEFLEDDLVHALFLEQERHFIDALCRQGLEDSIRIHIAEHGNLFAHFLADFMLTAADEDIRGDADAAQFLYAVLGRFGLQFAGSSNIRNQGDMDVEAVIAGYILLDLANGFKEGFTFNIPYSPANFRNDKIRIFFAAYAVDPFLDLVGNVRNDLYRTAR